MWKILVVSLMLLLTSCVHRDQEIASETTDTKSTLRCVGYCDLTIKDRQVDVTVKKEDEVVIDETARGERPL